jgi:hypothetical protein
MLYLFGYFCILSTWLAVDARYRHINIREMEKKLSPGTELVEAEKNHFIRWPCCSIRFNILRINNNRMRHLPVKKKTISNTAGLDINRSNIYKYTVFQRPLGMKDFIRWLSSCSECQDLDKNKLPCSSQMASRDHLILLEECFTASTIVV